MNAMKRFLLGSGQRDSQSTSQSTDSTSSPVGANATQMSIPATTEVVVGIKPSPSQHAALSLTHLRKLFSDFCSTSGQSLSEPEREARIYTMLPLFCRVFSHCPPSEMLDKFIEVAAFCQQVVFNFLLLLFLCKHSNCPSLPG